MADLLGYAASCAVLATFLMRTMVPLRLIAILSNVLFLVFGYIEHIYPVLFLHVALLPISAWRLAAARRQQFGVPAAFRPVAGSRDRPKPYAFWFAVGCWPVWWDRLPSFSSPTCSRSDAAIPAR